MGRRQFGTIRKLPSGRFQARYRDDAGNQVAAPQTFETKTAAGQWLAALQTDMDRGTYADPTAGAVTFADWAEDWMGFKSGQRPATLARDRTAIYTHFNPLIGDMPVGRIRRWTSAGWSSRCKSAVWHPRACGPTSERCRRSSRLRSTWDLIVKSPVRPRTLGLQPITRRERPTLSAEELYRLAGEVPDHCRALILIAGVVGLRWGEAIALRLCDVDLEERMLRVEQSVEEVSGQVRVVPELLKSSASRRRFAIPQVLADEIASHIDRHRRDAGPDDLLFIGSRGGTMRRSFTGRTFKDAVRRAGLPETLNFHGLRHVATSLMVANNEHPRVIQHRLGHADPHISMSVYAHVPHGAIANPHNVSTNCSVSRRTRSMTDPVSGGNILQAVEHPVVRAHEGPVLLVAHGFRVRVVASCHVDLVQV